MEIPCTIKDRTFKRVLIDFGSSVSLMPLSIFKKLGIEKISGSGTKLKFADHTIKKSYGVAEDVLVEIENFSFPVDFQIMDIPEDEETPIILGRHFLLTSRCNFDIETGHLTLKYFDEEITLKVFEIKQPGAGENNKFSVGMVKVEGESKISKSLPEGVSGIISQVASIKIPKFSQEAKQGKKKVDKGEKMKVGSNVNHAVASALEGVEFWVAESTSNKVWKRKYVRG